MTSGDSSSKWTNLKKIFETEGALAAFKHLTTADDGAEGGNAQSVPADNPVTRLKEAALQSWTSQMESMQTDFSCGFFAPAPKSGELQEDPRRRFANLGSEIDLSQAVIDRGRFCNPRLDNKADTAQADSVSELERDAGLELSKCCSIDEPSADTLQAGRDNCSMSAAALSLDDVLPTQSTIPVSRAQSIEEAIEEACEKRIEEVWKATTREQAEAFPLPESRETAMPLQESLDVQDPSSVEEHDRRHESLEESLDQATTTPEVPQLVQRGRKPTAATDWSNSDAMKSCDPAYLRHWSQLHTDLLPAIGTMQVVGCMEASEDLNMDKPVFLVSADGDVSVVDAGSYEPWIWNFATEGLELAVRCRSGLGESGINQDNFSIAHAPGDRAVFTVCDGHGPYGGLVAFRIAQCIPKLILEVMSQRPQDALEQVIATAFRSANMSLHSFAAKRGIDCSCSGATCTAVVRQGSNVHVAWLGDSRALVASVATDGCAQVNLYSPAHDVTEEAEQDRLVSKGSELHMESVGEGLRIAAPNQNGKPGLTVSRAFGDFAMTPHGLLSHPDLVKTSFASVPGFILLASGGACEFQDDDEVILERLINEGELVEKGVQNALSRFCDVAQNAWLDTSCNAFCDDVTALLLYWRTPSQKNRPTPVTVAEGPAAPAGAREDLAPMHKMASTEQAHAVHSSSTGPAIRESQPLPHSREPSRTVPSSSTAVASQMPIVADRGAVRQHQFVSIQAQDVVVPVTSSHEQFATNQPSLASFGLQQASLQSTAAAVAEGPAIVRRDNLTKSNPGFEGGAKSGLQPNCRRYEPFIPEGPRFLVNAHSLRNSV